MNRVVALVTGAGSGLGRATADYLASRGARVIGVDLNEFSAKYPTMKVDVTNEADVKGALELSKSTFGTAPNVVVNCAGILIAKRVHTKKGPHPLDEFMKIQNVNVGGTFNVIRLATAEMAALPDTGDAAIHPGQRGVVINTASVAAYEGQIGQAAYAASKGAIVGLTTPLARDLAREKVRVNAIAPGIFRTAMIASLSQEVQDKLAASIPFPSRLGEPDEYAQLVESLILNPYINGTVIRLDGATRLAPQ